MEKEEKTREEIARGNKPETSKRLRKVGLGMATLPGVYASYAYLTDKEYFVNMMTKNYVYEFYDPVLMKEGILEPISYNFGPLFGIVATTASYFFIDFFLHYSTTGKFGSYTFKVTKKTINGLLRRPYIEDVEKNNTVEIVANIPGLSNNVEDLKYHLEDLSYGDYLFRLIDQNGKEYKHKIEYDIEDRPVKGPISVNGTFKISYKKR